MAILPTPTGCEDGAPGYCARHNCYKSHRLWRLCQTRQDYFDLWEDGNGAGQDTHGAFVVPLPELRQRFGSKISPTGSVSQSIAVSILVRDEDKSNQFNKMLYEMNMDGITQFVVINTTGKPLNLGAVKAGIEYATIHVPPPTNPWRAFVMSVQPLLTMFPAATIFINNPVTTGVFGIGSYIVHDLWPDPNCGAVIGNGVQPKNFNNLIGIRPAPLSEVASGDYFVLPRETVEQAIAHDDFDIDTDTTVGKHLRKVLIASKKKAFAYSPDMCTILRQGHFSPTGPRYDLPSRTERPLKGV